MISYTSLTISIIGFLWIAYIISKVVVRKKDKKKSIVKDFVSNLVPLENKKHNHESLEFSFVQAVKTLKGFMNSTDAVYQMPWFLSIGKSNCGKTTFFNSANLEKPLEVEEFSSDSSLCNWHFFNNGVFLDLKGSLIEHDNKHSEFNWHKVLNLLTKVRPEKNLDGIVLFVSLVDLMKSDFDLASLIQEAEYVYSKLWQVQKELHLRLPIYIIFTHLDQVEGFDSFLECVPEFYHENIFGWSNSYSIENTFQSRWIDEMFEGISENFEELQADIFINKEAEVNAKVLLFFNNFAKLKKAVKAYTERIFQINKYAESAFLRGIYFVGIDSSIENLLQDKKIQEVSCSQIFVTDILTKKIFLERNLAKFVSNVNYNEKVNAQKINAFVSVFSLASFLYLFNFYQDLVVAKNTINPKLIKIQQMLAERNSKNDFEDEEFVMQSQILLNAIVNISSINLHYKLVPITWLSNLQERIFKTLENASDVIIVNAVAFKMQEKYKELAKFDVKEEVILNRNLQNPLQHHSFEKLNTFIEKIYEIEIMERKFVSATQNGNLESLAWLIKKLFNVDIPKEFYEKTQIFSKALKNNVFSSVYFSNNKEKMKQNADQLLAYFKKDAFVLSNFIERYDELNKILFVLESDNEKFSAGNLIALQSSISNLITFANSSDFSWMQSSSFNIDKFNKFINKVSYVFGQDYGENAKRNINNSFLNLKDGMKHIKMPIIGAVFCVDENNMLKISDGLVQMQGMLNSIFSEPFMQYYEVRHLTTIKNEQTIIWDIDQLNEILKIHATYEDFLRKKLNNYPVHLQNMLRKISKKNIIGLIESKLMQAQNILANEHNNASSTNISHNIKESFAQISDIIRKTKDLNLPLSSVLIENEKIKAINVLNAVDLDVVNCGLYEIDQNPINMAHLTKNFSYFTVNIADYLTSQRLKLQKEKEVIEPVIKMLDFLSTFDISIINSKVKKWENIIGDLNFYSTNPTASNLNKLEAFLKEMDVLKTNDLANLLQEGNLLVQSENYFQSKIITIKRNLYLNVQKFIKEVVDQHYTKSLNFYKQNNKYFPFSKNGAIVPFEVYSQLTSLMQAQGVELDVIKKIDPNIKHKNMQFVQGIERMHLLMKFLINSSSFINMEIKNPDPVSEMYEKNLEYLVYASVSIGPNVILFPDSGSLKMIDKVVFKFKLANQSNMRFAIDNKYYSCTNQEASLILGKKEFVEFISSNMIIKNGRTILIFELPIVSKEGKKKTIVYTLPIELYIDGVQILLPDAPLESFK